MRFGLCMIVKDEEDTIAGCLDHIIDACADVVVVDTGSRDRTPQILQQRYGITPLMQPLLEAQCFSKAPPRNLAFDTVDAPWILCLDADEHISAEGLACLQALPEDAVPAGYFCAWNTYKRDSKIEDYKLPLFRKGLRSSGCAHENIQTAVRAAGLDAVWLKELVISHYPDPRKESFKDDFYRRRLLCAMERDPTWYRYHWFLGYKCYRAGDIAQAVLYLTAAADADSMRFPVECLNSKMLLAEIHAQSGAQHSVLPLLESARAFLNRVADDFEVKVNFRIGPWIQQAAALAAAGDFGQIRAYRFPY